MAVTLLVRGLAAATAHADLTSTSYRARGGHVAAGASPELVGTNATARGSAGQREAVGWSGATSSLVTHLGGFWSIVRGQIPSLDADSDGVQAFLDADDDGDGLLDVVETDTGVFVSATDTGTNPLDPDTDGDGLSDGFEVANGTDPTSASSPPPVPALPTAARLLLAVLFAICGSRVPAREGGTQ